MKERHSIALVGAGGNFGSFIEKLATQTGFQVHAILEDTPKEQAEKMIEQSGIVVFSVPIQNTVEAVRSFAHVLTGDKLVMDVTGIKTPVMQELRNLDVAEIVGTHPMFGPFGENLQGKKIIVTPEKKGKKWQLIERLLISQGANFIELSPEEHDTKMAVIQALTHFLNMIFASTLRDLGLHPRDLEALETPIYRLQALISGRFLNQSPDLYAQMQMQNPVFLTEILPLLLKNMSELGVIDESGDSGSFRRLFSELADFFGPDFRKAALEKTMQIDSIF